jgi:MoxR-like ATPase
MKQRDRSQFPAGQFIKLPRKEEWGRLFEVEEKIQTLFDCNPPDWIAEQMLDRALDNIQQRLDQIDKYRSREPGELESLRTLLEQLLEKGWIGRFSKEDVEKMLERVATLAEMPADSTVGESENSQR